MLSEKWLNPQELEKALGIKKSTQAQLRTKGKIPYTKMGGFVYYNIDKIDQLLEKHSIEMR
jgi:hypothetical protein